MPLDLWPLKRPDFLAEAEASAEGEGLGAEAEILSGVVLLFGGVNSITLDELRRPKTNGMTWLVF